MTVYIIIEINRYDYRIGEAKRTIDRDLKRRLELEKLLGDHNE